MHGTTKLHGTNSRNGVMSDSENDLLKALHDEYAAPLWSFALRLTGGDRGRAEDVVQETLLRAWRHPEVVNSEHGSARSWLFTVARRIVIDEWRARQSRPEVSMAAPPERGVSDDTDQVLQGWLVADALAALSPSHRQVIVECFYRGHSVAEAASRLGVPEGTIKSRTHYALRALRLAFQEMGVSD
jgi:RNA polymerase sigma-70 factor (ECF subfamily)